MMSFESPELRAVLGRFATGICVITTLREDMTAVGITANSFSSVSLDPPLVLWSLQKDSERYADFSTPRYFGINVLSTHQEHLSTHYARRGANTMEAGHYRRGDWGVPLLHDALVSLECELDVTHEAGDHLIIIGRVLNLVKQADEEPLVFFGGAYRRLSAATG